MKTPNYQVCMSIGVCTLSKTLPSTAEVSIRNSDIKNFLHDGEYLHTNPVSDTLGRIKRDQLTIARMYDASVGYRRR